MVDVTVQIGDEIVDQIASAVVAQLSAAVAVRHEWLDVAEAAAYMRCEKQRIYDLHSQQRLRAAKDGSRLLFRREWLDEYLQGRGVPGDGHTFMLERLSETGREVLGMALREALSLGSNSIRAEDVFLGCLRVGVLGISQDDTSDLRSAVIKAMGELKRVVREDSEASS